MSGEQQKPKHRIGSALAQPLKGGMYHLYTLGASNNDGNPSIQKGDKELEYEYLNQTGGARKEGVHSPQGNHDYDLGASSETDSETERDDDGTPFDKPIKSPSHSSSLSNSPTPAPAPNPPLYERLLGPETPPRVPPRNLRIYETPAPQGTPPEVPPRSPPKTSSDYEKPFSLKDITNQVSKHIVKSDSRATHTPTSGRAAKQSLGKQL